MKKVFSVFFVAIVLLNTMGYYGLFLGLKYRNSVAMVKVLDARAFDPSQTLTVNIPVSVPYMTDQESFQRVNGIFEHNGQHYRLVEQRYAKDTLTVVCVRDIQNEKISQALTDYVGTFADNAAQHNQQSKVTLDFIKDYLADNFSISTSTSGWEVTLLQNGFCRDLTPAFVSSFVQPPEHAIV